MLHRNLNAMGRAEQRAANDLLDYLELKQRQARRFEPMRLTQIHLPDRTGNVIETGSATIKTQTRS